MMLGRLWTVKVHGEDYIVAIPPGWYWEDHMRTVYPWTYKHMDKREIALYEGDAILPWTDAEIFEAARTDRGAPRFTVWYLDRPKRMASVTAGSMAEAERMARGYCITHGRTLLVITGRTTERMLMDVTGVL